MKRLRSVLPLVYFLLAGFIFIPDLLRPGMFLDGLIYATLSRNMAEGLGTFWSPFFTHTVYYSFREHPPLGIWLGSLAFELFGDRFWVERAYSYLWLFILAISAYSFKTYTERNRSISLSGYWLPLLLLSVHGLVWSYKHNMLENLIIPLALLAHLAYFKSLNDKRWLWNIVSGLLLLTALFTKGLVTLYPLALPFWLAVFGLGRTWRSAFTDIFIQVSVVALGAFVIYFGIDAAKEHIDHYLFRQVWSSLKGERIVVRRTFVIERAIFESALPFLIGILAIGIYRIKHLGNYVFRWNRWTSLWMAMGLSALLPITVSPKQLAFYALPSLLYVLLFLLEVVRPVFFKFQLLQLPAPTKKMLLFAFVLPILLMLYQRGKPLRDAELLVDLARIEQASNGETFLGLHPDEHPSWLIRAYAFRLYRITLDADLYKYQQYVGRKPFDQKNDIDLTPENQEWKLYETPHLTHPDQLTAADRLHESASPNAAYR